MAKGKQREQDSKFAYGEPGDIVFTKTAATVRQERKRMIEKMKERS